MVPLMRDVGLDAHWQVILGREEFFNATKLLHNSLQGDRATLSDEQWELFERYNPINADGPPGRVGHDHRPRPAADRAPPRRPPSRPASWVWRCHIDLSEPNPAPIERLLPLIAEYDATVWHMQQYVPERARRARQRDLIPPAIDPLSPKNMAFSPDDAAFVCDQFGIDVDRPLICQVSRFDPWKDPMGVIDAYRLVTEEIAGRAARAGRLDGHRRPRGLGLLPTHRRVRRRTIPTSRSSTTSTTSARSRSTPSSPRPTSACRSRSARASG